MVPEKKTPEVRILQGVQLRVLNLQEAVALLDAELVACRPLQVAFANAHTLNLVRANEGYRQTLSRFLVLNDGVGVEWASRMRYGEGFPANLNGTDFLPRYLSSTTQRLRIFMLGAKLEVVERAFEVARQTYPAHDWVGYHDGYFKPEDEVVLCKRVAEARPTLLLVAMGNPLQEIWIDRCAASVHVPLCIGVGALYDFWSGRVRRAPAWVRATKLEWVYRLAQEPDRLWRRYLIGNLSFLWHAWRERR